MPRFFIESKQIFGEQIRIIGSDAKHIEVLRMSPSDEITAADGKHVYSCRISSVKKEEVIAEIIDKTDISTEPAVKVTLFQGIPKAAKMEIIIQKTVELGVSAIVPVITERSIPIPGENKLTRWKKISEAAAKQCGRCIIPEVHTPVSFISAALMSEHLSECYVAWELETGFSAREAFSGSNSESVGIIIGPEGGFSNEEIVTLTQHGVRSFSLGKRILRTETAGFAALICLMIFRGEL